MNEANYASLSAGLLARKGQAKPAMRPQSYNFGSDDDLGWNDMGGEDMLTPEQREALLPSPNQYPQPQPAYEAEQAVSSPVIAQQQQIIASFEPVNIEQAPVIASVPVVAAKPQIMVTPTTIHRPRAAAGSKAKAAFTLRLDPERHMQLRLACVYGRKSAQALVIAALDEYLSANLPDSAKGAKKAATN